ncbi:unnamed protein product [Ceutorhynchus assimilis]|uniref:Uncharacterized protein n=1 Tax=Ceutorhynchus assimilis TaxID=467358 RepID=A0A9N9MXL0_9CUCU|nr:unnamed protein product [Ceutorhynchus assimilis]
MRAANCLLRKNARKYFMLSTIQRVSTYKGSSLYVISMRMMLKGEELLQESSEEQGLWLIGYQRALPVCKITFQNTLAVSEKAVRMAISAKARWKAFDEFMRASALAHIQKFPKMETHYCRKSTSKEYLPPDLNVKKMFNLY